MRAAALLALWCGLPCAAAAQEGGAGAASRDRAAAAQQTPPGGVLAGELRVGPDLADSGTVILHRVSALFSGVLDSARVAPGGAFEFALPGGGDAAAGGGLAAGDVLVASARLHGIGYFGEPVPAAGPFPTPYLIQAYPVAEVGPGTVVPVTIRNVFLEAAEPGPGWSATDFFEVENGGGATLVASEFGATWSHALPVGATDFDVAESDLPAGAASFSGGRVFTSAPLRPGRSVYAIRYRIPGDAFDLPVEGATGSMELLVREPAGPLTVDGLAAVGPVAVEGVDYRRFAGRELAAAVIAVAPGTALTPGGPVPLVGVFLALALVAAGAVVALRRPRPGRRAGARRRELLVAVARLDEQWSRGELGVAAYDRRRQRLLAQLRS